jgi:hypothetical protein
MFKLELIDHTYGEDTEPIYFDTAAEALDYAALHFWDHEPHVTRVNRKDQHDYQRNHRPQDRPNS